MKKIIIELLKIVVVLCCVLQVFGIISINYHSKVLRKNITFQEKKIEIYHDSQKYLFGYFLKNYEIGDYDNCKRIVQKLKNKKGPIQEIVDDTLIEIMESVTALQLKQEILQLKPAIQKSLINLEPHLIYNKTINNDCIKIRSAEFENDPLYFEIRVYENESPELFLFMKDIECSEDYKNISIYVNGRFFIFKSKELDRNIYYYDLLETKEFYMKKITPDDSVLMNELRTVNSLKINCGEKIERLCEKNLTHILDIIEFFDLLNKQEE